MKLKHMKRRTQRGFTLVELAIVLVIAGLILVAVLRGTDAIQNAQAERMVADLRGLQGMLLSFQKRNGRLPGDCDNNGVLAGGALVQATLLPTFTASTGTATILDADPANRAMPATPVGLVADPRVTCIDATADREASINLVWNELRRAAVVDANRLPRELARHAMGDVFAVSSMTDTVSGGRSANVIVVYGIPVWMAEAVDAAIDGTVTLYGATGTTGPANVGRVRLWAGATTATGTPAAAGVPVAAATGTAPAVFTAATDSNSYGTDRDRSVAISYQFAPNKLVN